MTRKIDPITRDGYLTGDELVSLYSFMWVNRHDDEWTDRFDAVRAILGFGPRVSELANIRIDDCGLDGVVQIRNGKGKNRRRNSDGEFNKEARPHHRQVRVSPEYLPHYVKRVVRLKKSGAEMLFGRQDGKPYHRRTLWLWWSQVLEVSGVRHLKAHAGRHTYATWELASKRLMPHEVQAQLGHLDVVMTLGQYSHAVTEMLYQDGPPAWWTVAIAGPETRLLLRAV